MKGLLEYLRNSRAELGRVTWPTRSEVIQATQATILFVLITALFLFVTDLIARNGIQGLLRLLQG
jgi:preprotein translocase subunit SecE